METFDLTNACGRDYLKVRVKFAGVKLGFVAYTVANTFNNRKHTVPVRCGIGQQAWHAKWDRVKPKGVPRFEKCPFSLWYERDVDNEGYGLTNFRLARFDLRHSHPLCLKYD